MKKLLLSLILLATNYAYATNYYIANNGNDANNGLTPATAWATWERCSAPRWNNILNGGDTVFIKGGTYSSPHATNGDDGVACYWSGINGTVNNNVVIMAYSGVPMLDCSNMFPYSAYPWIVYMLNCNYVKFIGLHIGNIGQNLQGLGVSRGLAVNSCTFCTIDQWDIGFCGGNGTDCIDSQNILYSNCDSHDNQDALSDGVMATSGSLVVGRTYGIENFVAGDNFSNVGTVLRGTMNTTKCLFICTGTTPTNWTHGSTLTYGNDAYDNADAFNCANNLSTNIIYYGCRGFRCTDDGTDVIFSNGIRTYSNDWMFDMGYVRAVSGQLIVAVGGNGNGFKLGNCANTNVENVTTRYLYNCLSAYNTAVGFDQNGAPTTLYQIYNCTAYKNGTEGFFFSYYETYPGNTFRFYNNVSYANGGYELRYCPTDTTTNVTNTWSGGQSGQGGVCGWVGGLNVTNASFASVDSTGLTAPRKPDGSLPDIAFMHLTAGSILVNSGTVTSNPTLPYCQSKPDLGCFEYCPGAVAPTCNAGADQVITLPVNSVTLSGTATGTIVLWGWRKLTGGAAVIGTPAAQTTTATGLVQGVYTFELKVTDNAGLTATDTVQVTVNPAAATPPTCSAGLTPATITLPANSVALTGTGASTAGNTVSYLWTSVPAATITSATSASTTATGLTVQTYNFTLTVTDNINHLTCQSVKVVTVNPAPIVPVANAGADQVITLPTNSVSLTGSGSGGTINSYLWTVIQGIGGTLSASTSANTNFTGLVQGVYLVQLRVGNTAGNFGYDTVQITVKPAAVAPSCSAGLTPATITLPTNSVALSATGSSNSGNTVSFQWTQTAGTVVVINNANTANATAVGLTAGSYTFMVTVTDNGNGLTCTSNKSVTVNPAPIIPVANAGADQVITLPTNSVSLTGSGSGGTINSYLWTVIQGIGGTLSASTSANTNLTGLVQGVYLVQLRVGNTAGNFGYDTVQITVKPAIVLPVANAGADVVITLPTNSVALNGSASTGTGLTYLWTKVKGTGGTIVSPTSVVAQAQNLIADTFRYELKVTDINNNVSRDTMQVIVLASPIPPVVNAGADQTIFLPNTSTTLTGTVILSSGTVTSYTWTQISGAATTITTPSLITTGITGLAQGDYSYSLTVVTSDMYIVSDTVLIHVVQNILLPGFNWYNISLINGKANLNWGYTGATSNTSFIVQKQSWWWFNNIGTIPVVSGQTSYSFIDNNTKSGNNSYRIKYGNNYTSVQTVKKK